MERTKYRIVGDLFAHNTKIYRNGEPLPGVTFVKYEADADGVCMLTLTEEADVEIEWEGDEGIVRVPRS